MVVFFFFFTQQEPLLNATESLPKLPSLLLTRGDVDNGSNHMTRLNLNMSQLILSSA